MEIRWILSYNGGASERVDNEAADPCSIPDCDCFLSVALSAGDSAAMCAYLSVTAWQQLLHVVVGPQGAKAQRSSEYVQ